MSASRRDYNCVISPRHALPPEMVALATAIQRSHTPAYTRSFETFPGSGQADLAVVQDEINLWVICGSAGVLEFALIKDGDSTGDLTLLNVVAGQKVEGHFLRIGPQTTCFPLIGFGNLS